MTNSDGRDRDTEDLLHQIVLCGPDCCDVSAVHWTLEDRLARNDELKTSSAQPQKPRKGRTMKFIAMNRFKVRKGSEADFEQVWLNREVHLDKVPGFMSFHLLRGPERDDHILYSSHTIWASEDAFSAWTRSEAFRAAHRDAGGNKPLYDGHPEFEGFTVLQEIGQ